MHANAAKPQKVFDDNKVYGMYFLCQYNKKPKSKQVERESEQEQERASERARDDVARAQSCLTNLSLFLFWAHQRG